MEHISNYQGVKFNNAFKTVMKTVPIVFYLCTVYIEDIHHVPSDTKEKI